MVHWFMRRARLNRRLRIEQQGAGDTTAAFLTGMIEQHEKDAAQLLVLLEDHQSGHA